MSEWKKKMEPDLAGKGIWGISSASSLMETWKEELGTTDFLELGVEIESFFFRSFSFPEPDL